jgi:tRNA (guanine37-N1)-methyltransferase
MVHITILTLFPNMFEGPFSESIVKRAINRNLIAIDYVDIRDFASDPHRSVDDHPYGGGQGMIMRVDVVDRALTSAKKRHPQEKTHAVLLDPAGTPYSQSKAKELSTYNHLILLCGHYEGVDERIRTLVDEEISIGDYVLTGGEIPAMVLTDSVVRLIPGVLTRPGATSEESFSDGLLEFPQYTRPARYQGHGVPQVLVAGDHKKIALWRTSQSRIRTRRRRPDLPSLSKGKS